MIEPCLSQYVTTVLLLISTLQVSLLLAYEDKFRICSFLKCFDKGDSEDEESHDESRQKEDKDSVFARLEESRKLLEDKLGFSRFMKVYKYIQVAYLEQIFMPCVKILEKKAVTPDNLG